MPSLARHSRRLLASSLIALALAISSSPGQDSPAPLGPAAFDEPAFRDTVRPLFAKYCLSCHNAEEMQSGIRLDQLTATLEERQIALWRGIEKQLVEEAMPPADAPQPTVEERKALADWIAAALHAARTRPAPLLGSTRRLTVEQYRHTLRELLALEEDLTESLPADGISKDGFTNSAPLMTLSPLLVEKYLEIAERALDLSIVDERRKPVIQRFRMELGTAINPEPCPDPLVLGAFSALLNNADFRVTQPRPEKPFDFEQLAMRTKYDFIEGYAGNDTVRGWRHYDSIYHSVFACVRGTMGYPKGEAVQVVPQGLLLRPAVPSSEIFNQSSTYGPMANFKISLRELPMTGNFRVTVRAARYDDGLLLDAGSPAQPGALSPTDPAPLAVTQEQLAAAPRVGLEIAQSGVYQLDVVRAADQAQTLFHLELGERRFAGQLPLAKAPDAGDDQPRPEEHATAFLLVRLPMGRLEVAARCADNQPLRRLVFTRLDDASEPARRLAAFERRWPAVGVHVGLRRDCGSTLTRVGQPLAVKSGELADYEFEGAINDFPSPDVEPDNVNYLAGVREIGVRSEYTDGRDLPRLLVHSIDFEGPYYDSWPPESHRRVFSDSPHKVELTLRASELADPETSRQGVIADADRERAASYARELIASFAARAYRRPVRDEELESLLAVWRESFGSGGSFRRAVQDALLVVLSSPQFLFLIESSDTPAAEELDPHELASKLSYFLWNGPPDARLLELAGQGTLHASLDAELDRMIADERFARFTEAFVSQWLRLDKLDVVAIDSQRFPRLTREVRSELRKEPVRFVQYLLRANRPVRELVQADYVLANDLVASYYGLGERMESGFDFSPLKHDRSQLGGVLAQAGLLAGLSDGRDSNPVKRGAWLARKILDEPPDDPPPNVPKLPEDPEARLSLREKLEQHRNQQGCAKCHTGIDPWGLPLEQFDAAGLWRGDATSDAPSADVSATLPDGTRVADFVTLREYLARDRSDRLAFSFARHLASYAIGRPLTYRELELLRESCVKYGSDPRAQDLLRAVVRSEMFMRK